METKKHRNKEHSHGIRNDHVRRAERQQDHREGVCRHFGRAGPGREDPAHQGKRQPGSEGFEVAKELAGLYAAAYPDKSKYPYGFALIAPEGFSVAENKDVFEDDDGNLREGAYRAHGVGGQLSIGEMPPVKVAVDPKAIELLAKYRAARG
jgi:hypothetical protein